MIYQLVVPSHAEVSEEISVLEWHVKEESPFAEGDRLVELETQKVIIEVRATASGVLRKIICSAGQWQQLGTPIAVLSDRLDEPLPEAISGDLPSFAVEFEIG